MSGENWGRVKAGQAARVTGGGALRFAGQPLKAAA